MASLNISEWSPEQVAGWMTGLGSPVDRYVPMLQESGLNGSKLLTLRCDDLEYLGIHIIGHQELLLEAVEHLRNFQYERSRECAQGLAVGVCVAATSLARALRAAEGGGGARLPTWALADLAATVRAVKPLVCWLHRCGRAAGAALHDRSAALLRLSLEAAACAQRERFADHPARTVAACAHATANIAEYIVQEVLDPWILEPGGVECVSVRQGSRPLGFEVVRSFCGHHQLAGIRFGSPAHASGLVRDGDEVVQAGGTCVLGWGGEAVRAACARAAQSHKGELCLRLRRRAPPHRATPAHPRLPHRHVPAPHAYLALPVEHVLREATAASSVRTAVAAAGGAADGGASSSDESEPLSPPASPSPLHPHPDHTRLYGPKPARAAARRHSVCGGSPRTHRSALALHQLWAEVVAARGGSGPASGGGAGASAGDEPALYRRDKAVSYSTGLELSPRPQTCLGVSLGRTAPPAAPAPPAVSTPPATEADRARGRLDKSHSTPAYELDGLGGAGGGSGDALRDQVIPESPTAAPQSDEGDLRPLPVADCAPPAIAKPRDSASTSDAPQSAQLDVPHAASKRTAPPAVPPRPAVSRPAPREPPPPPPGAAEFPVLRPVPAPRPPDQKSSPLKPVRAGATPQISLPLRHITKHDIRLVAGAGCELPPLNGEGDLPRIADRDAVDPAGPVPPRPATAALSPAGGVRAMFPNSKTKGLKKKNSILAKRRSVCAAEVWPLGVAGAVWQRVRARSRPAARWARRHLLLLDDTLYAYRTPHCSKAECMISLEGFTVCCAGEVRSRAHAFKVYHTGTAFYFAAETRDAALAWVRLLHRATQLHPPTAGQLDVSNQYSETDYSETESDLENPDKRESKENEKEKEREKEKSKFGSLKKLTHRSGQRGEAGETTGQPAPSAGAASLDRKYLRFFSRARRDDTKPVKSKQQGAGVPVPTEHYRSYRRAPAPAATPASAPAVTPASPPAPAVRRRIPSPINYIHASNPNLLDFDKSDFVTKPTLQVSAAKRKACQVGGVGGGVVTLEQLMLQKQAEERRQPYSGRVLLGVQADQRSHKELARRLERIVPDVIYGEVPRGDARVQGRSLPPAPAPAPAIASAPSHPHAALPVSVKGKDGYERIVYSDEPSASELGYESISGIGDGFVSSGGATADRSWRDSLRRNDKVRAGGVGGSAVGDAKHDSWGGAGAAPGTGGAAGGGVSRLRLMFARPHHGDSHDRVSERGEVAGGAGNGGNAGNAAAYPHLQCPPTFRAETYSLSKPHPHPL